MLIKERKDGVYIAISNIEEPVWLVSEDMESSWDFYTEIYSDYINKE